MNSIKVISSILEQRVAMEDAKQKVDYLNNLPIFVATLDKDGSVNFVNSTAVGELGFGVGDVLHKHMWETPSFNYDIETREKSHSTNIQYVRSGIYRDDNSWLFCIGNYRVLFIFGKKTLQRLDLHNPRWIYRPIRTPTSQGFCIPIDRAQQLAERVIYFEKA